MIEKLCVKITPRLSPVEIQIEDDLFIAPVSDEERELSMLYLNHSCDPNLGMRGEITFAAMRDICAGEELTHDWAMTDDDDYCLACNCGAPDCRKNLSGDIFAASSTFFIAINLWPYLSSPLRSDARHFHGWAGARAHRRPLQVFRQDWCR